MSGDRRPHEWLMAALDGELDAEEMRAFDRLLAADADLREEWERMKQVKSVTDGLGYNHPPDEVWETFWQSAYNRVERGIGWIALSLGFVAVAGYGIWEAVGALLRDTEAPAIVRYGLFAMGLGGLILLLSVVREKLRVGRTDPFKEVQR